MVAEARLLAKVYEVDAIRCLRFGSPRKVLVCSRQQCGALREACPGADVDLPVPESALVGFGKMPPRLEPFVGFFGIDKVP